MQMIAPTARIAVVFLVVGVAVAGAVAQSPRPKLPSLQPKMACASSERPAPTRPAKPRISLFLS